MKAKSITKLIIFLVMFMQNVFGTLVYLVDHDNKSHVIGKIDVNFEKLDPETIAQAIKTELKMKDSVKIEFLGDLQKENSIFLVETENGWVYPQNKTNEIIITIKLPNKTHEEFLVNPSITILDLKNLISKITRYKNFEQKLTHAGKNLSNNQILIKFNKKTLELNIIQPQPITFKVILDDVEIADEFSIPSDKTIGTLRFEILKKLAIDDQTEVTKITFEDFSDYSNTLLDLDLDIKPQPIEIRAYYKKEMPHEISWRTFLDNFNNFKSGKASPEMKEFIEPILLQIKNHLTQNEDTYIQKIFMIENAGELAYQKKYLLDNHFSFNDVIETFLACSFNVFALGIISDTISALLLAERIKKNKSLNEILDHLTDKQKIENKISNYIKQNLELYIDLWLTIYNNIYSLHVPQEIWDKGKKTQILESDIHKAAKKYYPPLGTKTPDTWNQFTQQFTNLFTEEPPTFVETFRVAIGKRMAIIVKIANEILESSQTPKVKEKIDSYFKITRLQPDLNKLKTQIKKLAENKNQEQAKLQIISAITYFMKNFVLTVLLEQSQQSELYENAKKLIPEGLAFRQAIIDDLEAKIKPQIGTSEKLEERLALLILNNYLTSRAQWYLYDTEEIYIKTVPNLQKSSGKLKDLVLQNEVDFYDAEFSKILLTIHFALIPEITFQAHEKKSTGGYISTLTLEEIAEKENWGKKMKEVQGKIGESDVLQRLSLKQNLRQLRNNLAELKTKLHQLNQKLETLKSRL